MRTASRKVIFTSMLLVVAALVTSCSSPSRSPEYEKGYSLGLEAFTYGLPLLVTDATYKTMTSPNVSTGAMGPANRFNNVRGVNTASSKAVVAPGSTSLSSIAWVDLSHGPQVLHVPKVTDHYFVLALIDPYTENIACLGTASQTEPGDYALVTPPQRDATLPAGVERLDVDYPRIWIIGSTQLKGPGDVASVNEIQDGYTLTPLSQYGTDYRPPEPSKADTTVTEYKPPSGMAFYDELGRQLAAFPPPAADAPTLKRLAEIGVGPGKTPSTDSKLTSETVRGMTDAISAGPAQVQKDIKRVFARDFGTHEGYLLGGFGQYGTDYTLRAVISQIGLGAFVPHQAIYAMSWSDHDEKPLSGSSAYVLHMASPPPTDEGWSLTVYDDHGALIANPLDRYAFSNTSELTRNPDGSVDFYLQSTEPTDTAKAKNWLPVADGQGFEVTWRLFAPDPPQIDAILGGSGWQPPEIEPAK